eukprot:COSAG02_NODE_8993_length_2369_cov_2.322907_3_plen_132_part_00
MGRACARAHRWRAIRVARAGVLVAVAAGGVHAGTLSLRHVNYIEAPTDCIKELLPDRRTDRDFGACCTWRERGLPETGRRPLAGEAAVGGDGRTGCQAQTLVAAAMKAKARVLVASVEGARQCATSDHVAS